MLFGRFLVNLTSNVEWVGMRRIVAVAIIGCFLGLLGGCQTAGDQIAANGAGVPTTVTVQEPTDVQYYPSDQPLRLGMEHFGRGQLRLG